MLSLKMKRVGKMEGFIIAAVIVAWFVSVIYCFDRAINSNRPFGWMLSGVVLVVLVFGLGIQKTIDSNNSGPCIAYEERSVYDPALKAVRKADVCVERGVWKE